MKKIISLLLILFTTQVLLIAQSADFGIWSRVSLTKKLKKHHDLSFENGVRFDNNLSNFQNLYLQTDYSYKLNEFVKFSVAYRFARKNNFKNTINFEHRNELNIRIKKKFDNNFSITNRSRLQTKFKNYNSSELGNLPISYLRNKITVDYKINKSIKPYISYELFYPISTSTQNLSDKERYYVGSKIKINKKSDLELYYLFQRDKNVTDPMNTYILGVEYQFDIN